MKFWPVLLISFLVPYAAMAQRHGGNPEHLFYTEVFLVLFFLLLLYGKRMVRWVVGVVKERLHMPRASH